MDGMQVIPQVLPLPLPDLSFSYKRWNDDPPSILHFNYAPDSDTGVLGPFSDETVPVTATGFQEGYPGSSEAVDDAFAISPIFNPDRAFPFTDPGSPLCDSHSPLDGTKGDDSLDFDAWLRGEV